MTAAKPVLMLVLATMLVGCTGADSNAIWPALMRASEHKPVEPPPPDIKQLIAGRLDAVFAAGSQPTNVKVSAPQRDPHGKGWTACVRADVNSVVGKPLGTQTYRIFTDGTAIDRRRAEPAEACNTETFEPIS